MLERSRFTENENDIQTWTVLKARNVFLTVIIASALFLILKNLLFLPQPTERPYLISKVNETEIMKALRWYTNNSAGSLKLEDNRCILEKNSEQTFCKASLETRQVSKALKWPLTLQSNQANWPYIWLTKAYDQDVALEFALFALEPVKIISRKERTTVLGDELVVEVEFKRTALTSVSAEILEPLELEKLRNEIGTNIVGTIAFLPNPYGYYLPIYPLP